MNKTAIMVLSVFLVLGAAVVLVWYFGQDSDALHLTGKDGRSFSVTLEKPGDKWEPIPAKELGPDYDQGFVHKENDAAVLVGVYTAKDDMSPKQLMTVLFQDFARINDLKINLKSDDDGDWAKLTVTAPMSGREGVMQIVARRVPGHPEFTVCFVGIWTSDFNDVVARDFNKTVWSMTVRSVD